MRIDDLAGLDPKRLSLSSRGLKCTGPRKEVPFYVARRISLSGVDWLKVGLVAGYVRLVFAALRR